MSVCYNYSKVLFLWSTCTCTPPSSSSKLPYIPHSLQLILEYPSSPSHSSLNIHHPHPTHPWISIIPIPLNPFIPHSHPTHPLYPSSASHSTLISLIPTPFTPYIPHPHPTKPLYPSSPSHSILISFIPSHSTLISLIPIPLKPLYL